MSDSEKNSVGLKVLCQELKLDPRDARAKLRIAAKDKKNYPQLHASHQSRKPWRWEAPSAGLDEARKALSA